MKPSTRATALLAMVPILSVGALVGCSSSSTTSSTGTTAAASGTGTSTTAKASTGTTAAGSTGTAAVTSTLLPAPAAGTVDAVDFTFTPPTVPVKAGEPVTFLNKDDVKHEPTSGTPTAEGDAFKPVTLAPGATGTVTFSKPGEYPYYCSIHDSMVGTIVVT